MEYLRQLNRPSDNFEMIPRKLVQIGLSMEAVGYMVTIACLRTEYITLSEIEAATGLNTKRRRRIQRELEAKGLLTVKIDRRSSGTFCKRYEFNWDSVANVRSDGRENTEVPKGHHGVIEAGHQGAVSASKRGQKGTISIHTKSAGALPPTKAGSAPARHQGPNDCEKSQGLPDFAADYLAERRHLVRKGTSPLMPPESVNVRDEVKL